MRLSFFGTQSSVPSGLQSWAQNRLQEFEGDQRHDSRTERQGEVVDVQRPEGEELACKRPQQAKGEDRGNGGQYTGQRPVWPSQCGQQ